MKTFFKIITVLFFMSGYAQQHNFDSIIKLKTIKYKVKVREIKNDKILLTVFSFKKKVIFKKSFEAIWDVDYHDFNHDGNPDIMLMYMGNNASYELYLYDSKNNTFKEVAGFIRFPDAKPLKSNPKYYYSYNRAGCADMNWESKLFKIVNFETIYLGRIYGKGCNFEVKKNPQTVEIYKILNNNENQSKLIKTLPFLKYVKSLDNKWEFDENYWNKNYKKFQ